MRPERQSSSTPMNRMPCGGLAMKLPGAAARLEHGSVPRDAEAGESRVHGLRSPSGEV